MIRSLLKLGIIVATAACAALTAPKAEAVLISGNITFGGTVTLDSADAATATSVTSWHALFDPTADPQVGGVTGDFDTFINPGTSVTFAEPWVFTTTPTALWNVGGFQFTITQSLVTYTADSVTVAGLGTVVGNGFEETAGTFNFTTQNPDANGYFTFSASSKAVPDGGLTIAMLGVAMVGVEGLRRRMLKA